jgi:hypothetical protein
MADIHNVAAPLSQIGGLEWRDLAALISATVAIVAVLVGGFTTKLTLRAAKKNAEAAAWQKANEAELKSIQQRLDSFYGPFRTMSEVNRLMFRVLRARTNADLVLMRDLFDNRWREALPPGEAALLREVAANAKTLRKLIEVQVGMVDAAVMPYLSRASAHYRMLEMAYEGQLGSDPEPFKWFVFPASIDTVLGLEVERLERRRAWLLKHPFKAPPPFASLEIPAKYTLPEWPNPKRTTAADLTAPLEPKF